MSQSDSVSRILGDLIELLERHGVKPWVEELMDRRDSVILEEPGATEKILELYGGMGTFNDLYLCQENGHRGTQDELFSANERLRELQLELVEAIDRSSEELGPARGF